MKPHKIIITIEDKPDCSSCDVAIDFNPAYQKELTDATPAVKAFRAAWAGLRGAASKVKSTEVKYESKPDRTSGS